METVRQTPSRARRWRSSFSRPRRDRLTPAGSDGVFGDVPCPSLFAASIEELAAEGNHGRLRRRDTTARTNPNTRGQMAVLLVKTFPLGLLMGRELRLPPSKNLRRRQSFGILDAPVILLEEGQEVPASRGLELATARSPSWVDRTSGRASSGREREGTPGTLRRRLACERSAREDRSLVVEKPVAGWGRASPLHLCQGTIDQSHPARLPVPPLSLRPTAEDSRIPRRDRCICIKTGRGS